METKKILKLVLEEEARARRKLVRNTAKEADVRAQHFMGEYLEEPLEEVLLPIVMERKEFEKDLKEVSKKRKELEEILKKQKN